ncbi:MAG: ribonuclease [Bacilli bacterium]|nr:ribonuclease [Bacilli bacterium]
MVEGIHDKQAIDRAVDADCLISGGSACGEPFLRQVQRAAQDRGVIILTDPDSPGQRIRRIVAERVPQSKHAFLPKSEAIKNGDLGIENASPAAIRAALLNVRSTQAVEAEPFEQVEWQDLVELGLSGASDSAVRRHLLGDLLGIGYGNAKTFWKRLVMLRVTRVEFIQAYEQMQQQLGGSSFD